MIPAARKRDTGATAALTQYDRRSYWIPGCYAPPLSKKHHSFLRLLKNKGFKEESMTKVGLDAIGTSTTLESNKSLPKELLGLLCQLYSHDPLLCQAGAAWLRA